MNTQALLALASISTLVLGACAGCGPDADPAMRSATPDPVSSGPSVSGSADPIPAASAGAEGGTAPESTDSGSVATSGTQPPSDTSTDRTLAVIQPAGGDYGSYAAKITTLGRPLQLNGAGLCEYGMFGIDLYRAAFYVEQSSSDSNVLIAADQVSVIHLHFVRALSKAQLTEAYTASTKVNTSEEDFEARYRTPLATFCDALEDAEAGNSLTCTSEPGVGLHVQVDGKPKTVVKSDAFRALFLKLYLGDKPPTEDLKSAFLNGGK